MRTLRERLQDGVLTASGGPVWLIIVNGEATGVEVHVYLGQHSAWEQAADELVEAGLLTKGHIRAGKGPSYTFTKRGQIARWAIGEVQRIEADRRSGRAA